MGFNNVPVNGWPQIKELEKLDALAKQIEGMPTFTSNDRAWLDQWENKLPELPADPETDGVKVLTATTESGETVKSWEEQEAGVVNYSTTEQKTGQKWIDGKDIYFKTVEIENPVSSGTPTSINHGANVDEIVKIEGYGEISGVFIPVTYYASANYYTMVYASASAVVYDAKWDNTQFTKLVVTIYYTKSET